MEVKVYGRCRLVNAKAYWGCATLLTKAMTSSQPEAATDKNIPSRQAKKMRMRMIRMHRLWHPSTRTCQGALAAVDLISCGFPMALTLPQCHRILLTTLPTTQERMTPITNPKSPGPRFSPIQALSPRSSQVLYHTTGRCTRSLDNFPQRCYN